MPCFSPLTGFFGRDVNVSGKRSIVFDPRLSLTGEPISLPCGQCVGCRLERSRQWAMRCVHEAKLHRDNCFVTLTYDDDHLPLTGQGFPTLVKRDLQLFMKRLRFFRGSGIRFYSCGEYGERTLRPHYHVILFNCDFKDRVTYRASSSINRFPVYSSQELQDIWSDKSGLPIGRAIVGDMSFDSAAYVARYVLKKVSGDDSAEHYYGRLPEFTNMSRRPGLGTGWFEKYGRETFSNDSVIIKGRPVRPPRFYDGLFEVDNAEELRDIKRRRKRRALLARSPDEGTFNRARAREVIALARLNRGSL